MGKADQRLEQLIDILKEQRYASIKELAGRLDVSEMTIRRDIKKLEEARLANNFGGRMFYNHGQGGPDKERRYELLDETGRQNTQKERIGRYAASMVEHRDIIVVDTGTTTQHIIPHLPTDRQLTVLCYNINILLELRHNTGVEMLFAGGHYHPNTQMFTSTEGLGFIQGIRAQKAFISAAGVHGELGVTCANGYEVPTKKAVMRNSLQKILVADSSKFGAVRSDFFCELSAVDDIVTDSGLPAEWRSAIEELGINLHLV